MASLAEYCVGLASDPAALKEFRVSKAAACEHMKKAGLSKEQRDLIMSEDSTRISNAMAAEFVATPQSSGPGYNAVCHSIAVSLQMPTH